MTDRISDAIRIVAARLHPSSDAVELRRLAFMVARLERTVDEFNAAAMDREPSGSSAVVLAFRKPPQPLP